MSQPCAALADGVGVDTRPLIVFDLDGTLLRGDSFLPFLVRYAWRRRRLTSLLVLPLYVVLYVCRLISAQTAKERLLIAFFQNETEEAIAEHADWFCANWVKGRLRSELLNVLRSHQAKGDRVILLSASPDLYVPAIARFLDMTEVICTRVAWSDELCLGRIVGTNCKGDEKVHALQRYLQQDLPPEHSTAYGDSRSDLPLLCWVSQGFLLRKGVMVPVNGEAVGCRKEARAEEERSWLAGVAPVGFALFGVIFCVQWAAGLLVFPLYKQRLIGYLPVLAGALAGLVLCWPRARGAMNLKLSRPSRGAFLIGVIALALGLRLASLFVFPTEPTNDHRFFHLYALDLLQGKGYGEQPVPNLPPMIAGGSPKAFYPPGMTLLLVCWYWLTAATPVAGQLLNVLLGIGMVLLVYDIGRLGSGEKVGRWAALLTATMPSLVFYGATLGYEVALGTIFCLVVDLALRGGSRPKLWHIGTIGALTGFGALLKPICLLVPALLFLWWLLRGARGRAVLYTCGMVAVMAAVIAPWTLRNYRVFHEFVPVSTNGGYVLYSANNPKSEGIFMIPEQLPGDTDEVGMDRARSRAASQWIRNNPVAFARLALIKTMLTWGTSSTVMSYVSDDRLSTRSESLCMAVLNTFWTMLLVCCLFATFRTNVWKERRFFLAYLFLAYLFALHLVFEAHSRHHLPVVWVLTLIAAYGLALAGKNESGESVEDAIATNPLGVESY